MGGCSDGNCSSGSCSSGSCSDDKDRLPPGMLSRYDLNQQTGLGTLIWAETTDDGKDIEPSVLELLGKIRDISDDRIFAMITGSISVKPLYNILFEHGVDTLYHIRCKEMEEFRVNAYAEAMADLSARINPMTILFAGTDKGDTLADLTAGSLGMKVMKDCDDILLEGTALTAVFKNDGGESYMRLEIQPHIATLRPGSSETKEPIAGRTGTAISRPFRPKEL